MPGWMRMSLLGRFVDAVRIEGPGVAMRRAGGFLARRLFNRAPDTVPAMPGGGATAAGYLAPVWATLARQQAFHVTCAPALARQRRKLAIIGDLNLPQCRKYRVEQLAEFWRAQGVEAEFAHHADIPRATAILQDATHLACYRLRSGPAVSMYLYEARRLALPVLYDIDDPLFSVSAYETYGNMDMLDPEMRAHFAAEAPAYLDVMNGCDIVSVSTPGLVAHAAQLTPRPVHLRRNFADRATLDAGEAAMRHRPPSDGLFRVAFASGSQGHEADFATIAEPLAGFLAADPRRRLMVLGHFDHAYLPQALRRQTETHGFAGYDTYLATLARADCAVMPLADDLFNRCKSAVRTIDAGAVGVPSICGMVGDCADMIEDGRTGLIARDAQGWSTALNHLADDTQTRRAMGLRARQQLERRWSGRAEAQIIDRALLDWVLA